MAPPDALHQPDEAGEVGFDGAHHLGHLLGREVFVGDVSTTRTFIGLLSLDREAAVDGDGGASDEVRS